MIWTARTGTPAGPDTAETPVPGPVDTTPTAWWVASNKTLSWLWWHQARGHEAVCGCPPGWSGQADRECRPLARPPCPWYLECSQRWPVARPQLSIIEQIMPFTVCIMCHCLIVMTPSLYCFRNSDLCFVRLNTSGVSRAVKCKV